MESCLSGAIWHSYSIELGRNGILHGYHHLFGHSRLNCSLTLVRVVISKCQGTFTSRKLFIGSSAINLARVFWGNVCKILENYQLNTDMIKEVHTNDLQNIS